MGGYYRNVMYEIMLISQERNENGKEKETKTEK